MSAALWWIVLGFAAVIAELFLTSFIVVFFGVAAIVVGMAIWLGLPAEGGWPYFLFGMVSLGLLFGLRSHFQRWMKGRVADSGVDEDFIGREARVISGFTADEPGRGRIDYRGSGWNARADGKVFPEGALVRIVGREGITLVVEAI
ncbi:MAG: NfeD family protein [Pseudomonadales bacterium]